MFLDFMHKLYIKHMVAFYFQGLLRNQTGGYGQILDLNYSRRKIQNNDILLYIALLLYYI